MWKSLDEIERIEEWEKQYMRGEVEVEIRRISFQVVKVGRDVLERNQ